MALIFEPQRVALYNLTSQCEEADSLPVITPGKQWICTPDGAALLALYRSCEGDTEGWVMDAYALEQGSQDQNEQALFNQILTQQPLAYLEERVCFCTILAACTC